MMDFSTPAAFKTLSGKISSPFGISLLLAVIALLCEAGALGNPFPFSEQQYYLYGGGQILQHQIPYVDFWDRKPAGLFLLFAPIHFFGAYRFYALPLFAACFMWAGSLAVFAIARQLSCGVFSSFLASAVYLIGSNAYPDETGGQAEQFYIPLLVCVACLIIHAWPKITVSLPALFKTGICSLFVVGIALELKTSCAWDGVFLTLSLFVLLLQQPGLSLKKRLSFLLICIAAWGMMASLPTLILVFYYWTHGYLYDWVWANIINHHLRSKAIGHSTAFFDYRTYYLNYLKHAAETCFFWGMPVFCFAFYFIKRGIEKFRTEKNFSLPALTPVFFLFAWGVIALIASIQLRGGYQAVHYTMACMPAAVVLGALLWEKKHWGKIFLLVPLLYFTPKAIETNFTSHISEKTLSKTVTSLLAQQEGCLFQLSGAYLFYDLTKATSQCRVNKFLLSGMLTSPEEQFALGVNREDLFLSNLEQWPLYVVLDSCDLRLACNSRFKPQVEIKDGLWATNAIDPQKRSRIQEIITQDYVPLYQGKNNAQGGDYVLYKLRPGLIPKITPPDVKPEPSSLTHGMQGV